MEAIAPTYCGMLGSSKRVKGVRTAHGGVSDRLSRGPAPTVEGIGGWVGFSDWLPPG